MLKANSLFHAFLHRTGQIRKSTSPKSYHFHILRLEVSFPPELNGELSISAYPEYKPTFRSKNLDGSKMQLNA